MNNETVLLIMAACAMLLALKVVKLIIKKVKRNRYNKHLASGETASLEYIGITVDRFRSNDFNVEWYNNKDGSFKHF